MSHRLQPVVGNWYAHLDKGDVFQVVAYDEEDGTIEIQDFDGGVDEFDVDTWKAMPLEAAAQAERRGLWMLPEQQCPPWRFRKRACQ